MCESKNWPYQPLGLVTQASFFGRRCGVVVFLLHGAQCYPRRNPEPKFGGHHF